MDLNDKKYWETFYSTNNNNNINCSDFCIFVMDYFTPFLI